MAGLLALSIAGCGGGSDGAAGAPGAAGATGATGATGPAGGTGTGATASVNGVTLSADQWQALTPKIDPASITVSINSPPVVTFKVTDGKGNPVVGLGGQAWDKTKAIVPTNFNLAFTLAKLVPGANNEPSKWVSYLITKPGTVAAPATVGAFPQADNQGTMVDNGDGSYKYTFYRDVKQAKAFVDGLVDAGLNLKADLGDVSYDPTLTHRLGIMITGSQPGTGTATPTGVAASTAAVPLVNTFNIGYDFVPAGGAVTATRDIVMKDSCSSCHDGKGIGHVSTASATNGIPPGAFVGRNDPRLCVTCHTDQTKYGFAEAKTTATGYDATSSTGYKRINGESAFTFPRMIHQTHMGADLVKTGYNLNAHARTFNADGTPKLLADNKTQAYGCETTSSNRGACYNLNGLPQSPANCTTCHDGSATKSDGSVNLKKTTNGDNWKMVPSILACGSCHDGIDFKTGAGITLGNKATDEAADAKSLAASKVTPFPAYVPVPVGTTHTGHVGLAQPDNSSCVLCHKPNGVDITVSHRLTVASLNNPVVKAGIARFEYKLTGVTINASKVVAKFQVLKDDQAIALPAAGFTGGPSFLVVYATGQDGIVAPSDWNSKHDNVTLDQLLAAGAAGDANGNMLTVDAATNTYTATLAYSVSKSHTLAVPTDAKMVTAMMAGSFMDANANPLPGIPAMMAATGKGPDGVTDNVARRVIFKEAKCNSCHDRLGTSPNFHGGNYSIAMCAACHTPIQGGSTGWSASFRVWVHGIHSASKRVVPFTWHAVSATETYASLGYPGVLKDCKQCHEAGTYDFSASQYTDALVGSMLNVTAASGTKVLASSYVPPQAAPVGSGATSGLLAYGLKSGANYGVSPSIDAMGKIVAGDSTDLVSSPITATCSACHDSAAAIGHYASNNGSFYQLRSAAATKPPEACLVCHGPGKIAAIADVHK